MNWNFTVARTPQIRFGVGAVKELPQLVASLGEPILVVTGRDSISRLSSVSTRSVLESMLKLGPRVVVDSEPSPEFIDAVVESFRDAHFQTVLAWGGGSVLDAGKALAAMLGREESVCEYLEGIGTKTFDGHRKSLIAIPTTAGTGSEATKNAVLSRIGPTGFKKSLRHDSLTPDLALVDPELTASCPKSLTAACGMDAVTQLLEAFVSRNSSPVTDALALSGLKAAFTCLPRAYDQGDIEARIGMSYAALLSGIVLANAGLGVVHGFASPIGGFFSAPHGVICGTLLAAATAETIITLRNISPAPDALRKYASLGALIAETDPRDLPGSTEALLSALEELTVRLRLPRLTSFGIQECDLARIVAATAQKYHPITLSEEQLIKILKSRL